MSSVKVIGKTDGLDEGVGVLDGLGVGSGLLGWFNTTATEAIAITAIIAMTRMIIRLFAISFNISLSFSQG
jgi:hypothetical protein